MLLLLLPLVSSAKNRRRFLLPPSSSGVVAGFNTSIVTPSMEVGDDVRTIGAAVGAACEEADGGAGATGVGGAGMGLGVRLNTAEGAGGTGEEDAVATLLPGDVTAWKFRLKTIEINKPCQKVRKTMPLIDMNFENGLHHLRLSLIHI